MIENINEILNNQTDILLFNERIGSTWLLDSIYMFIITPIGFIGGLLNLFGLFILSKIKTKRTKLYQYLKFYSINGSLACFACAFVYLSYSPKYYPYYYSYISRVYRAYIHTAVSTTLYFISDLVDVVVALERLSIFVPKYETLTKFKPYLVCIILSLACVGINLPTIFSYYAKNDEELLIDIKYNLTIFAYNGRTEFFYSKIGFVITFIQIIIRDILTLIIEIVVSSIGFAYYRKFNAAKIEQYFVSHLIISSQRKQVLLKKYHRDRQLLFMNLIQNSISIFTHFFIGVSYGMSSRGVSAEVFIWICVAYFCICFKHFSNFFTLYFFNLNFKNTVGRLFRNL
jgi:hypothetical protein